MGGCIIRTVHLTVMANKSIMFGWVMYVAHVVEMRVVIPEEET